MNSNSLAPSHGDAKSGTGRRNRRYVAWVGFAVLTLLIVAGLWPKALPVEVASVERDDLLVTVNEEGMTRVRNRFVISSPVAGQLERIDWKAGAEVIAGKTVLAALDTSGADLLDARGEAQAEARVKAAQASQELAGAQLARAEAAAELSRHELDRLKTLAERGAVSRQELDGAIMRDATATQDVRAAEFTRQIAEFELQQARALLLRGRPEGNRSGAPLIIRSPVNGRILRVFQESARVVPGGLPLLEIGDPTDLELRIEVLSRDGVTIHPGAHVWVDQWGGEKSLEARVRLVEPSAFTKISALGVEEQRVYVIADFISPPEARPTLGDSYRIEARVLVWEGKDVLHVSAGALFQRGNDWQTFAVKDGRAHLTTVRVGRSNGLQTEIRGGLKVGDRVVVYPGDKVRDGSRIEIITVNPR
jgi:HlyD family secretion protein